MDENKQAEPVGEIQIEDMGQPFNAMRVRVHFYKEVPQVGAKIYTKAPAVAVNEQMLEALKLAKDELLLSGFLTIPLIDAAIEQAEAQIKEQK